MPTGEIFAISPPEATRGDGVDSYRPQTQEIVSASRCSHFDGIQAEIREPRDEPGCSVMYDFTLQTTMNEDPMKTKATGLAVAFILLLAFSANGFSGPAGDASVQGSSTGCQYREAARANGTCPDVCPYTGMHRRDVSTGCPYLDGEADVEGTTTDCPYLNGQQTDHGESAPEGRSAVKEV